MRRARAVPVPSVLLLCAKASEFINRSLSAPNDNNTPFHNVKRGVRAAERAAWTAGGGEATIAAVSCGLAPRLRPVRPTIRLDLYHQRLDP
jgi:hypothetical protein